MLDKERIKDKIGELRAYLKELKEDLPEDEREYVQNRVIRRSCEKTFELACASLVDICNLIIAGEGLEKPKDNRDSVQRIMEHSIISADLARRLKDMISFRNLLVHGYARVDYSQAYQHLKHELGDFFEFIVNVDKFLEGK